MKTGALDQHGIDGTEVADATETHTLLGRNTTKPTTKNPSPALPFILVVALCVTVAALTLTSTLSRPRPTAREASVVRTALGSVHGSCSADGIDCRWLNVPFSEPPFVRFGRSRPRTSSYRAGGVGSGARHGPACPQFILAGAAVPEVGEQSEDCLHLDVYAPYYDQGRTTAPLLPVMVFVHGGGFLVGSSGQNISGFTYDGTTLAAHGVVVVVLQYRLGVFGFLPRPDGTGGANGIGDQLTALQWVAQHIAAFGGDPDAVTVFGESAGSVSVCLLAHLPSAQGLFRRAIAESGVCYASGDVIMSATEARQVRAQYLHDTGLSEQDLLWTDASEITNRTVQTYDPHGDFTPLFVTGVGQPSVDGDIFPDVAEQLSPLPGVDLLHGYNSGETKMIPPDGIPHGALSFFTAHLGSPASAILARYDGERAPATDIVADACLRCQSVRFARRVARTGANAYFYVYDNPHGRSMHGAELPAVFGTADEVEMPDTGRLRTSEAVVRRVQRIWTDFAKGRDLAKEADDRSHAPWPNVVGAGTTEINAMLIGEETSVMSIFTQHCSSWEAAESSIGGLLTARMCNHLFE